MYPPIDPEIRALRETFVRPFSLRLLHGNFVHAERADGDHFRQELASAARTISGDQIARLLTEGGWDRLCAAWFTGLSKRANLIPSIGNLLLASEAVYAGQGYCAALGLVGSEECAHLLHSYLETYLPLNGRVYDQDWAIGALAHIEGVPPQKYLDPALWGQGSDSLNPVEGIEDFREVVSYLRRHRMIEVES